MLNPHIPTAMLNPHIPTAMLNPHIPTAMLNPHIPTAMLNPHIPTAMLNPHIPTAMLNPHIPTFLPPLTNNDSPATCACRRPSRAAACWWAAPWLYTAPWAGHGASTQRQPSGTHCRAAGTQPDIDHVISINPETAVRKTLSGSRDTTWYRSCY